MDRGIGHRPHPRYPPSGKDKLIPRFDMRRREFITLLGSAAVAWHSIVPASAEIEKFLRPCEQKLCPFFRASLAIPKGWQEDQAATKKLNMQVLVPRGKTYNNAEAVIYATVTFNPEKKPIADFIAEDH